MSEVLIRRARQADLPAIVAMLADDVLGRAREDTRMPLTRPIWMPSRRSTATRTSCSR